MCGIFGYSLRQPSSQGVELLNKMASHMQHRGPDGFGTECSTSAGLGMLRLRMRASENELEPIALSNNRFAAYNGEIYSNNNGILPDGGHDEVQVILSTPKDQMVDGMYALAVLDITTDTITLKRDSFGIKPLYFLIDDKGFFFASEIAALLTLVSEIQLNQEAIHQFLGLGKPPSSSSGFLSQIHELDPGHSLIVKSGTIQRSPQGWTVTELLNELPIEAPNLTVLRDTIRNSVRHCIDSRYSVGVAVSGGLDSSIICAELNELGVENLHVISVLTEGGVDGLDKIEDLRLKGEAWKTWTISHVKLEARNYLDTLRRSIRILGTPSRMSSLPLYVSLADKAAEAGKRTLLIGEGADELFCGYQAYQNFKESKSLTSYIFESPVRELLEKLIGLECTESIDNSATMYFKNLPGKTTWEKYRMSYFNLSLQPLLTRVDHALMSGTVEGRTPFLHSKIPHYAFRFPDDELLRDGRSKDVLRTAYTEILSSEITHGTKTHFRAPLSTWFSTSLFTKLQKELVENSHLLLQLGINYEGLLIVLEKTKAGDDVAVEMAFKLLTIVYWRQWLDEFGEVTVRR